MVMFLLWLILIIPWLTMIFYNTYSLKRFMPVSIFVSLLVTLIFQMGYVYKWWIIGKSLVKWGHITSLPITFGSFLVGTLWIFHFTYDKGFKVYFITNV